MLELTPEQRVVLQPCSWETYDRILAEHVNQSSPRFTYSEGRLEIMSPSFEHERATEALRQIVYLVGDLQGREVECLGSATIRRNELNRGVEPDAWFNFDRADFDPDSQAPDLAIEVEVSQSALDKLPILAAIGVPELWRTDLRAVTIYRLQAGSYVLSEQSGCLSISSETITRLLRLRSELSRSAWLQTAHQLLS